MKNNRKRLRDFNQQKSEMRGAHLDGNLMAVS